HYKYILKDIDNSDIFDGEENRFLNITIRGKRDITVTATWNSAGDIGNVFFSDAFSSVLLPTLTKIKSERVKGFTHEFRVKAPLLKTGETICLIGSTKSLGSWNTEEPIFLSATNNWFITQLQLGENEWPATYKYGIYDTLNKKLIFLEDGDNRVLPQHKTESSINILHDGFVKYNATKWKGAGVSIPVFSLRSQKSFGTGEFPDIKLL